MRLIGGLSPRAALPLLVLAEAVALVAAAEDEVGACLADEAWRKNLEEKCVKLGFTPVQVNNKVTQFTGVGTAQTQGKWKRDCDWRNLAWSFQDQSHRMR